MTITTDVLIKFTAEFLYSRLFGIRRPLLIGFSLTSRCPFQCKYCLFSSSEKQDLSFSEITRIIDKLYAAGMLIIQFTGGEPCIREDLSDIIAYTKNEKRIAVILSTTGYNIKSLDASLKYIDLINLSLDGDKQTHDRLRGEGNFDMVMSAADFLRHKNKKFYFRTVLNAFNLNSIDNITALAEKYQTKVLFQPLWFKTNSANSDIMKPLIPDKNLLDNTLKRIIENKNKGKPVRNSLFALKTFEKKPEINRCIAGRIFFRIEPDGIIRYCCRLNPELNSFDLNKGSAEEFKKYLQKTKLICCPNICSDGSLAELNGLYNFNPGVIKEAITY